MLQVVWQRVISLHSGVDLASTTTVVAAFLGGLGVGSLLGGRLADRLGPRRSLSAFAARQRRHRRVRVDEPVALLRPLPRARAEPHEHVRRRSRSTPRSCSCRRRSWACRCRLCRAGVTSPASADAGRVDRPPVRHQHPRRRRRRRRGAAGCCSARSASRRPRAHRRARSTCRRRSRAARRRASCRADGRRRRRTAPRRSGDATSRRRPRDRRHGACGRGSWSTASPARSRSGFEQVFFRLIDAVMRSNSYSFAHVLTLYLAAVRPRLGGRCRACVRPGRDPRRWFLWLQFGSASPRWPRSSWSWCVVLPAVGFDGPLAQLLRRRRLQQRLRRRSTRCAAVGQDRPSSTSSSRRR